jgi:hypothetical protein
MEDDFLKISKNLNAVRSILRVPTLDPKYKIAVLASNQVGVPIHYILMFFSCYLHNESRFKMRFVLK